MYLKVKSYDNGKPILFGLNCMRTPFSVAVKAVDVSADTDAKKNVTEGSFVVAIGSSIRFLPRTRVGAATAINSNQVTLKAPSFSFKVGDVLKAQAGYGTLEFHGTVATSDIITVQINGVNYSSVATATQTTPGKLLTLWISDNTTALNAAGIYVTQRGVDSELASVVAKDSYAVNIQSTGAGLHGVLRSTSSGFLGASLVPLGTIASIAAPNAAGDRVATLAANASYVLPINSPVGVDVDKYLGIYAEPLDLTEFPQIHIAPIYHADGVYEANLPYCDLQIKRELAGLNINKRFYKNV